MQNELTTRPKVKVTARPVASSLGTFFVFKMNRITRCVEDDYVRVEISSTSFENMTISMIDLTGDPSTQMVLSLNLEAAKKLNDLLWDAIRDMEKGPKDGI